MKAEIIAKELKTIHGSELKEGDIALMDNGELLYCCFDRLQSLTDPSRCWNNYRDLDFFIYDFGQHHIVEILPKGTIIKLTIE